jgi:hypothetical protein
MIKRPTVVRTLREISRPRLGTGLGDSFVRRRGLCGLQFGEPLAHPARHGEVALALVAVECPRERRGGFIAAVGGGETLVSTTDKQPFDVCAALS